VSISSLNGGAVAMHAYGRRATEATLLLRSKMLDIEDDLQKKGFSDFDDERHGDFTDENPSSDYTWSAEILKPDVQLESGAAPERRQRRGNPRVRPAAACVRAAAAPGASPLMSGPLSGVMQNQAKAFVETLKKSVREIRLTVSWPNGKERRSISASQTIVILRRASGRRCLRRRPRRGAANDPARIHAAGGHDRHRRPGDDRRDHLEELRWRLRAQATGGEGRGPGPDGARRARIASPAKSR